MKVDIILDTGSGKKGDMESGQIRGPRLGSSSVSVAVAGLTSGLGHMRFAALAPPSRTPSRDSLDGLDRICSCSPDNRLCSLVLSEQLPWARALLLARMLEPRTCSCCRHLDLCSASALEGSSCWLYRNWNPISHRRRRRRVGLCSCPGHWCPRRTARYRIPGCSGSTGFAIVGGAGLAIPQAISAKDQRSDICPVCGGLKRR